MIVLDADVLLIDLRYQRDRRFAVNRQALDQLSQAGLPVAITCHTLLEILGVCTFNLSQHALRNLTAHIPNKYQLRIIPDPLTNPVYAGAQCAELEELISRKLSLGDALTGAQTALFIPHATCLVSWNARHFAGKLPIPALTPEDWLRQNVSAPTQSPAPP